MDEKKLNEVKELLEDIKGIMLLVNYESLESSIKKIIKSGSVEEKVYKLCDGKSTIQEISAKILKTEKNVSGVLAHLRKKGLVKTFEKNGKIVHIRRF